MQFKKMIEEMSSIFWGLSLAFNIILLIIGLPLCLLICCCCRKHQGAIERDIKTIARNHNLLQVAPVDDDIEEVPTPQVKKRRQAIKAKPQPVAQQQTDTGLPEIPDSYELEE